METLVHTLSPADYQRYYTQGLSYAEYRTLVDQLVRENRTSGPEQSQSLIDYTQLNQKRMQRIEKIWEWNPEHLDALKNNPTPEHWIVITEAWCGDAAQIIPVLDRIAQARGNVHLRMLLRDENPELMNAHLYNGTKSIPILVRLNQDFELLGQWGPRPEPAQQIINQAKQTGGDMKKAKEDLHLWYARNKGQEIVRELLEA
ncbi:thioredoxin family protein [bacterium]|nr:thioredoxin family protein [bacterium]